MPKILRAGRSDNFNKKLQSKPIGQVLSGSKHDPEQLTKITRAKRTIRRVMVPWQGQPGGPGVTQKTIGGNTNWRSSPAAMALTDNPNPKFDPSQHPTTVQVKRKPITKVTRSRKGDVRATGHGKELRNPQNTSTLGQKINKR